jgi:hypothetical protein
MSFMRIALAVLLTIHALIHLMGFLKAFGFAELPQLKIPISKPLGVAWLVAALALLGAAAALFVAPRAFWLVGAFGILISQIVIVSSWSDARVGTFLNVVVLLAVVHGAFSRGPFGLHAAYERAVRRGLTRVAQAPVVTDIDAASTSPPPRRSRSSMTCV